MTQTVEQALKQANLVTDGVDYVMVSLPAGAITAAAGVVAEIGEAFCALIADKHEVTLFMFADAVEDFITRLPGHKVSENRYRLITLDVPLEETLVGFMACISQALAEAGVPILPVAAFAGDHILVPADRLEVAMEALRKLQSAP